jgi:hypothetical protein
MIVLSHDKGLTNRAEKSVNADMEGKRPPKGAFMEAGQ